MNKFFLLMVALAVGYVGFRMGEGTFGEKNGDTEFFENSFASLPYKMFTFVVYASNHADWCERSLSSLFAQDYGPYRVIFIDDASIDHTYEKTQRFVMSAAQDERVIMLRSDTRLGFFAALSRAMEHCLENEIIIPLQAKDWLCGEDVLSRLNKMFQYPDVWAVRSYALSYPEFQEQNRGGLVAFNVSLLKKLPTSKEGASLEEAYERPLIQLCKDKIKTLKDPCLFINSTLWTKH
ncbi:MAG: glycosyltransferase family 2 protein [Chlamydiales bacterium]|nr:glycosyltransferase family 2 protein [Chlamydiales bacterium]